MIKYINNGNKKIIHKRAKELRDLAEKQHNKFLVSQIGTIQKVLVENNSVGHSTNFSKIKLKENVEACTIVSTKILEINPDGLLGTIRNLNGQKRVKFNGIKLV